MNKIGLIIGCILSLCIVLVLYFTKSGNWLIAFSILVVGYLLFFLVLFLKRFKTGGLGRPRARYMRK